MVGGGGGVGGVGIVTRLEMLVDQEVDVGNAQRLGQHVVEAGVTTDFRPVGGDGDHQLALCAVADVQSFSFEPAEAADHLRTTGGKVGKMLLDCATASERAAICCCLPQVPS